MDYYILLFLFLTCVLMLTLFYTERNKHKTLKIENVKFHQLQTRYLVVFGLATFSDWLQGAYLFKIYSSYNYDDSQIAIIYIFGFLSSGLFGWMIGNIADHFGRKKICVLYNLFYIISCYLHSFKQFEILICARIFGGLSSCILFSSFESWYIYEHCSKNNFPEHYLSDTFAKSTFINGITAVLAGLVGNFLIEYFMYQYIFIFYLAMLVLIINAFVTMTLWSETKYNDYSLINNTENQKKKCSVLNTDALRFIIFGRNCHKLLLLGVIQLLFETVMYDFIFIWTPVLNSRDNNTPYGLVFSYFMMSIMMGSTVFSNLSLRCYKAESQLILSGVIALFSFASSVFDQSKVLLSFILYEFSVGIYFPCMSYIRSVLIPEHIRNSVANWFRLPINILSIISLLVIRNEELELQTIFCLLSILMLCAVYLSFKLKRSGLSRAILPAPILS